MQVEIIKLSELNDDSFKEYDAWQILPESYEGEEYSLRPADKNENGEISRNTGDVWCLCKATFANKEIHVSYAMCRGDSSQGPILWSFFNGEKSVNLVLPPVPDFVLEMDGPKNLGREFKKSLADIFPIVLMVVPSFEISPKIRTVILDTNGTIDEKI